MSKPLYIPNDKDLSLIQSISGNDYLYKYIITKVVEKILNSDDLLKETDSFLLEMPEIVNAVCMIFPQEINYSKYAKYDVALFLNLMDRSKSNKIYNLDALSNADSSVFNNQLIIERAINILAESLSESPEYRFKYRNNALLDTIFSVKYEKFNTLSKELKDKLILIEPIYFFKFIENYYQCWIKKEIQTFKLNNAISMYSLRYGIPKEIGKEYRNHDILEYPNNEVKKLIKYMRK